jgi:hypothetical protein
MANTAIGEVDIELDGKTETLKSTPKAARAVSAIGGGFLMVANKITIFDLDVITAVVAAGLGKRPTEVENAVYSAGAANLAAPLNTFVTYLANGGKPTDDQNKEAGSGEA